MAVKKKENESFLRWKARDKAISKAPVCKKSFSGYVLSPLSRQPCPAALPEENAGWSIILIIYLSSVYKFINLQIYGSLIPVFFYLLIYI